MVTLTKVVIDNLYETIHSFVESNKVIIEDYEGMVNLIIRMIKGGHCFTMDRDILRDAMESLTYMYAPSDDMNKDRLINQFVDDNDSDEEDADSEEGGEFGNMDMLKMMQMMGGMAPTGCPSEEVVVNKEGSNGSEDKICQATGECCKEACFTNECVKEEPDSSAENVD
tara:strand:- start:1582 stop:2088 length:507 start_codon:yes stop_codon:yes gene_type:complete